MPAFTAVGAYVAGTLLGLVGTAAIVVGAVVATGAAYITSRIINGNQNKGNNSAATQGGRIQVPPATNNKIPVVYGSAYVNGIITDARLKSLGGTNNDTMYYCLVLSEYTNNLTTPSYGIESVVWNDLRLTAVDATTSAHKVKDGRKVVDGAVVTAGSFVVGKTYVITKRGTTDFTLIGAQTNNIGQVFTATGVGSGTGQAQEEDFIDTGFIVDNNSLVELRVYAGGSGSVNQIYPAPSTGNTVDAYTFWGNNDGSWTSANEMKGLVFAIVKMTYAQNGFTSLPNVTFQLANNIANPADVWYDYMTSKRYGAGIPAADIDSTARTAWYNYCAEDINYTSANLDPAGGAGTADQVLDRYQINGILDTSNQVKTNIDTILQNGGAWMSYNVATGLWSPVIKKAVTAGVPGDATTYFTASRANDANKTLTVTSFPNGRLEPGQLLYTSDGSFRGTVTTQQAIAVGDTSGQIGKYTTSTAGGAVASTTWYATQPTTGTLSFNDDNIISGINISSTRLEDLYNKVEVEFYDKYNKDQKAYYRTTVPSLQLNPNEPDNTLRMSLDLCNNSIQSDLLGQIELRQSRDDLVIEFTSNHYGIQTQAGDIIQVTSDLYGWEPKLFRAMRVKEQETEEGGLVAQIQALEYNADAYTIESISEFSTAANIKIGNLVSSVGLPAPVTPIISNPTPGASVPSFLFSFNVPATGGPFDEAEIYYTEGWDPFNITGSIVAGTGSNGAPVGKGLLTVTAATYNQINAGDYLSISTSGDVIVDSQLTPTGGEVAGGVGRYIVTVANLGSLPVSGTTLLYDQPIDSDYVFLKKVVPDGNATAFVSPSTVTVRIVELPANSQTYRRYFLKSRLGNKKNFSKFSPTAPFDLDNNINWNPNPTAAGSLADLTDVDLTPPIYDNQALTYDTSTNKWGNHLDLAVYSDSTNPTANTNAFQIYKSYSGAGTIDNGFGVGMQFNVEDTAGNYKMNAGEVLVGTKDKTLGAESYYLSLEVTDGGLPSYVALETSKSDTKIAGNLTINNLQYTNSSIIYAKGAGANSTLTWNGTNWTFANQFGLLNNSTTTPKGVQGEIAGNDYWFVGGYAIGGTTNTGAMVIASGNNGDEPIYVRQYTGGVTTQPFPSTNTVARELTLLDSIGDTILPGTIYGPGADFGNVTIGILTDNTIATTNGPLLLKPNLSTDETIIFSDITRIYPHTTSTSGPGTLTWDATVGQLIVQGVYSATPVPTLNALVHTTVHNVVTPGLMMSTEANVAIANGFGTGIQFYAGSILSSTNVISGDIELILDNDTTADSRFDFRLSRAGTEYVSAKMYSNGDLLINGDLTVIGDGIKSSGSGSGPTTAISLIGTSAAIEGDLTVKDGTLILNSLGGGAVALQSPSSLGPGAYRQFTLPDAYPVSNGYALVSTTAGVLSWAAAAGDVIGPASATDNAVARFNLTTGKLIQNSGVIIDDSNNVTGVNSLTIAGDIIVGDNSIKSGGVGNPIAIQLLDNDVSIQGDLTLVGNRINNNVGYQCITTGGGGFPTITFPTVMTTTPNLTLGNSLKINGSTSGYSQFQAPATGNNIGYVLPGADGTSGQVLSTNGSGTLSWATASGSGSALPAIKSESLAAQPWSTLPGCVILGSIGNSLTITAQQVRYQPFYVSAPITLTEVALQVSTATTLTSCNAMIYIVDVTPSTTGWQPSANRSGGYCGEITNITTTGIKNITGLSISLPAGSYLMAVQFSNYGGTLQCRSIANQVITGNGYCFATSDGTTYAMNRSSVAYVSGTPATAANWSNGAYGNAGHPGVVWAKWTVN